MLNIEITTQNYSQWTRHILPATESNCNQSIEAVIVAVVVAEGNQFIILFIIIFFFLKKALNSFGVTLPWPPWK